MPLHDVGYRRWAGTRSAGAWRWWVIAVTGTRLAWKSSWLRRMLLFAWLPSLIWAIGFFIYEQFLRQQPDSVDALVWFIHTFGGSTGPYEEVVQQIRDDPLSARHLVWSALLMLFFRAPQALLMVMVVGLVAPPLISQDVRSRAFIIYFSRPLSPFQYMLGKACVIWAYVASMTCLPALCLYLLGVLLSPDPAVVALTWDLPLRILVASVVLVIPTSAVALCFSSLTSERRFATFAWFAMWAFGWVTYWATQLALLTQQNGMAAQLQAGGGPPFSTTPTGPERWITLLSPYHTLGHVQEWVFGVRQTFTEVLPEAALLFAVTLAAVVVLRRRVTAPMRI